MSLETVLAYALGIIGALLTMLIALVVYVFVSLKGEVRGVAADVTSLTRNRVKLMHRDDCRTTTQRFQSQLDEMKEETHELSERVARVETALDLTEHCS